jgi:hypothetical protein
MNILELKRKALGYHFLQESESDPVAAAGDQFV